MKFLNLKRRKFGLVVMDDYEESPRHTLTNGAVFVRVCPFCGRFVEPDVEIRCYQAGDMIRDNNAYCSLHGRVAMPFEGFCHG